VVTQAQFDRWAELMKAGDYEAALAATVTTAAVEPETKLASNN
jgi:cytochrome c oxidase subunit 2